MNLESLKVADLKNELKNRGMSTTGNKAQLIERLSSCLMMQPPGNVAAQALNDSLEDADLSDILNETPPVVQAHAHATIPHQAGPLTSETKTLTTPPSIATSVPTFASTTAPSPPKNTIITTKAKITISSSNKPPSVQATPQGDAKPQNVKAIPENDRLQIRAQRFGNVDKKQERAARFGITTGTESSPTKITADTPIDPEKLKKRAERFGAVVSSSLKTVDAQEKQKQRQERFGDTQFDLLKPIKRTITSGSNGDEDKKRARLARFNQ